MADQETVDRHPRTGFLHWTVLPASQQQIWDRITTPEGINHELMPLLRMTVPPALRGVGIGDLEPGAFVCRSWLILGGLIPVDYDDLTLEEIDAPRRFREHSQMLMFADWIHERTVRPVTADISVVEDRVSWIGRGPVNRTRAMRAVQQRLLRAVFVHRHHRLTRHFATRADPDQLSALSVLSTDEPV
jgi:hypothetical protein